MTVKWTGAFLIAWVSTLTLAQDSPAPSDQVKVEPMKSPTTDDDYNNIAFELPDLTATDITSHGEHQLEAYKSVYNDKILDDKNVTKAHQLIWVSVGKPTFIQTKVLDKTPKLFQSSWTGFYTMVEMLTQAQRKLLAATATKKYRLKIDDTQIVNLILSKFECSIVVYEEDGSKNLIKGKVTDFRHFPLRMDFFAPPRSIERRLFVKYIEPAISVEDLQFTCNMASKGKKILTNILTITSEQIEQIGLETKLFGPSSKDAKSVYVSREQSSELSREMYASLNIYEDYEIPETQFAEAFVNDFIKQVASQTFTFVPVSQALAAMSSYGFDVSADLKPDVVEREMSDVLKIETKGEKSRIVTDESFTKDQSSSSSSSGKFRVKVPFVRVSAEWGKSNSERKFEQGRSVNDQLNELNTASHNHVKWEIQGNKVIPKSVNVAQVSRANFKKTLEFKRVRVQKSVAPFDREFSLYTSKSIVVGADKYIQRCRICVRHYASKNSVCSKWSDAMKGSGMRFPSSDALYYYTWNIECA